MGGGERRQQLLREPQRSVDRVDGAAVEMALQVLPLDELHHCVGDTLVAPGVVQGDDVRVVQPAGRAHLGAKARFELGFHVGRQLLEPDRLDRDTPLDVRVEAFVDAAHRPHAQGPDDFVAAELLRRHGLAIIVASRRFVVLSTPPA